MSFCVFHKILKNYGFPLLPLSFAIKNLKMNKMKQLKNNQNGTINKIQSVIYVLIFILL